MRGGRILIGLLAPVLAAQALAPSLGAMVLAYGGVDAAYALLLETIGMPETEFSAFMEYEAMKAKHD